jgi:MICOS complex subunit MIC26
MPGAIYVLIAAMGSSILVRNRSILLRFSLPVAVGIGAGWAIIPVTMRNVGDLAWRYEQKFPAIADTHVRVKDRVTQFVQTSVAHSKMSAVMLEDKIREGREKVEEWVSKGK